jgi:uncharacterized ParB-like nuclease family protein
VLDLICRPSASVIDPLSVDSSAETMPGTSVKVDPSDAISTLLIPPSDKVAISNDVYGD